MVALALVHLGAPAPRRGDAVAAAGADELGVTDHTAALSHVRCLGGGRRMAISVIDEVDGVKKVIWGPVPVGVTSSWRPPESDSTIEHDRSNASVSE